MCSVVYHFHVWGCHRFVARCFASITMLGTCCRAAVHVTGLLGLLALLLPYDSGGGPCCRNLHDVLRGISSSGELLGLVSCLLVGYTCLAKRGPQTHPAYNQSHTTGGNLRQRACAAKPHSVYSKVPKSALPPALPNSAHFPAAASAAPAHAASNNGSAANSKPISKVIDNASSSSTVMSAKQHTVDWQ